VKISERDITNGTNHPSFLDSCECCACRTLSWWYESMTYGRILPNVCSIRLSLFFQHFSCVKNGTGRDRFVTPVNIQSSLSKFSRFLFQVQQELRYIMMTMSTGNSPALDRMARIFFSNSIKESIKIPWHNFFVKERIGLLARPDPICSLSTYHV